MTTREWRDVQGQDLDIKKTIILIKEKKLKQYRGSQQDSDEFKLLLKFREHLQLVEEILHQIV